MMKYSYMELPIDSHTLIVFDLDDTLYNELDFLRSAYREIAMALDPENWQRLFASMFSLYREGRNVFETISMDYAIDIGDLLHTYRNHAPDINPFEGVHHLMERIGDLGGQIGLLTDGRSKTQRAKIEALKIGPYLDKVVISEEFGSEKPNARNYEAFTATLKPRTAYYIADNFKKDFITAKALGWRTVGLLDNGKNIHVNANEYVNKKEYLPDHYILEIKELEAVPK